MVTLKGTEDGLLITLGAGEWSQVLSDLASQLDRPRAAQFFHGAFARLMVGDRRLSGAELTELGRVLEAHEMQLDLTPTESRRGAAREEPEEFEEDDRVETSGDGADGEKQEHESGNPAVLVRRTIRSGQTIEYAGHVVIFGDVNPGSEITAGGDVIVWGRLRGLVHAGASGDEGARVSALQLAPMQLRIGSHIARAPDDRGKSARGPEVARVKDGRIVIETWKTGRE